MKKNKPTQEKPIEVVAAEIVDMPLPLDTSIPVVAPEDVPDNALTAPDPSHLIRQGYFQKGGLPGPGRPQKYNREKLADACYKYFADMIVQVHNPATNRMENKWIDTPTVTGLARYLGIDSRTLYRYQESDDMGDIICAARAVVQEYIEKGAIAGVGNPAGKIFILKNMGMSDNQTVTFAPPSRLQAAKTTDEIAKLVDEDIVD